MRSIVMSHTLTLKINIDVLLRYGQNRVPWPNPAKLLWPITSKDFPRCKVGMNLFHVRSDLQ